MNLATMRSTLFAFLLSLPLVTSPLFAQGDPDRSGSGATLTGRVVDSVASTPLADALVQLVSADRQTSRSATTDSQGWFTIAALPAGQYTVGFLHPMLDSLGLDSPLKQLDVVEGHPARVELAIPSPARIRAAICGPQAATDSSALVVGIVRDASSHAPAGGASVTGEWMEIAFESKAIRQRLRQLAATTGDNGWFALCNVPRGGTIGLRATRGADSTDLLELRVPESGLLRRELYLAPVAATLASETFYRADTTSGDSVAVQGTRRVRSGDGRLSGRVSSVEGNSPLAKAQVRIADGPSTRTNERGEWTLIGIPAGTRMLEVRALGFYPEQRAVNVVEGAAAVEVTLNTMRAVLDTVIVTARRSFDQNGFLARSRTGAGRYLNASDIQRHRTPYISDMLGRVVGGIDVVRAADGSRTLKMRGVFEDRCTPALFVDGIEMKGFNADDLDGWVNPEKARGVEVYNAGFAPAEFVPSGMGTAAGCGVIVVWTR